MTIQQRAKSISEELLSLQGFTVNSALPFIELPTDLHPQTAEAVARRSMALCYMIGLGYNQPGAAMLKEIEKWKLDGNLTAMERELLAKKLPSEKEKLDSKWLAECNQMFGWALSLLVIDHFRMCGNELATKFPMRRDPTSFILESRLRDWEELYLQSDLYYRLHWHTRDAQLGGRKSIISEGIVRERRRAIDWIIGLSPDWDDMPLDT